MYSREQAIELFDYNFSLLYKQKSHLGNYSKVIGVAHRPKQTSCFLLITESEFSIGRYRGANRQSFGMAFPFAGPREQNINPKGCSSVLRSDGICPTKLKLPGTSALCHISPFAEGDVYVS